MGKGARMATRRLRWPSEPEDPGPVVHLPANFTCDIVIDQSVHHVHDLHQSFHHELTLVIRGWSVHHVHDFYAAAGSEYHGGVHQGAVIRRDQVIQAMNFWWV